MLPGIYPQSVEKKVPYKSEAEAGEKGYVGEGEAVGANAMDNSEYHSENQCTHVDDTFENEVVFGPEFYQVEAVEKGYVGEAEAGGAKVMDDSWYHS